MSEDRDTDVNFDTFLPSKTKMAAIAICAVLVNITMFVGAVGVIAYAVKWVISTQ